MRKTLETEVNIVYGWKWAWLFSSWLLVSYYYRQEWLGLDSVVAMVTFMAPPTSYFSQVTWHLGWEELDCWLVLLNILSPSSAFSISEKVSLKVLVPPLGVEATVCFFLEFQGSGEWCSLLSWSSLSSKQALGPYMRGGGDGEEFLFLIGLPSSSDETSAGLSIGWYPDPPSTDKSPPLPPALFLLLLSQPLLFLTFAIRVKVFFSSFPKGFTIFVSCEKEVWLDLHVFSCSVATLLIQATRTKGNILWSPVLLPIFLVSA